MQSESFGKLPGGDTMIKNYANLVYIEAAGKIIGNGLPSAAI
jgi:hypothetical protein